MNSISPNSLLTFFSIIVIPCWLLMIFLPNSKMTNYYVKSYIIPVLIALAYLLLLIFKGSWSDLDFSTLEGIYKLFGSQYILLAGWLHYLAFDIMIGLWILEDSKVKNISHRWIIIPLLFTFYFGPIGFLQYFIIRFYKK